MPMPPEPGRAAPGARPDPGLGVFETLRLVDGRIQALDAHLARLAASVRELYGQSLPSPLAQRLRAPRQDGDRRRGEERMRIDVTPHDGRLGVTVVIDSARAGLREPLALTPVTVPGGLGAHKWRDRALLDSLGADPVPLLVDRDGSVLEAAWANVWLLRDGRLTTPPADGRILPGVTRAALLERAPALGLGTEERPISLDDLRGADAIVLTSSVRLAVAAGLETPPAREPPAVARLRAALVDAG